MTPEDRIHALGIWQGPIEIAPIAGGITNRNYLVTDRISRRVVRLGVDIPVHHISRQNELAASQAAHAAGLSPAVIHHEPGVLVLDFIEARALTAEDIQDAQMLARIVPLVRACHHDIPLHFRGQAMIFWVFHVIRDYAATLVAAESGYAPMLPALLERAELLEQAAGPFDIAFGHNDLLAANFLDDGKRLWLIDWDYAGFNTPLFDLGGLASNNEFSEGAERQMLETYFGRPLTRDLWQRYSAMKCSSLLRETLWSMVSEIHSTIDFNYAAYTAENLARFERAYKAFEQDQ
ncbi:phosphotransferase [Rhizobium mongolense]|uniref:Thiamine kinase-like enzyme n=2 Tax=Rhizobium mongolense TaxID=57676 RepID=A0ABR6IQZ2_9HYPH|nr:phosphotransferase [Rhizobium mongolense]MBB4230158.1 thiamine kinase-like enzyme [Rhizobium mongolense]TVZ65759.1 thiamine kinase-like enzyme [Rhizobium mongolense USDA 1844]